MSKFRKYTSTGLICIAVTLLATSLFGWTKQQRAALEKCMNRYVDDYLYCLDKHDYTVQVCKEIAGELFGQCCKDGGLPIKKYPLPQLPQPPGGPGQINPGSPTPGRVRPPTGPSGGQIKGNPTPSPTPSPTPRRSSSPSKHKP